MSRLTVSNLSKSFVAHTMGGKTIHGFSDVSFTAGAGQAIALQGPSGAGKSSILKCIYRTYRATAGTVVYKSNAFGAIDLVTAPEQTVLGLRDAELGYVTQFLRVIPRVSAVDVVAEPLLRRGVLKARARGEARRLLSFMGIPDALMDAFPVTFSGGEQQRVNLARAIIRRPRLMLLDEPTASLDATAIGRVLELLQDLLQSGTTIVAIFHDPRLIARLGADTVAMPDHDAGEKGHNSHAA